MTGFFAATISPAHAGRFWAAATLCALVVLSNAGCGWFGGGKDRSMGKGPKIGGLVKDLPQVALPTAAPIEVTREDVMVAYERVYGQIPNTLQNHAVGKRLADLEMAVGEERDIEGLAQPYDRAVSLYEELLAASEGENRDEIVYQLARAHDIAGDTEQTVEYLDRLIAVHPDSRFIAEARFRRAEISFSFEDYEQAAADYAFVVDLGDASSYLTNAQYMLGWSEFKLGNLEAGLMSFFRVIDSRYAAAGEASETDTPAAEDTFLSSEVVDDSFRVVVLALGYLDGAATLAELMEERGRPGWQFLAYQRLATDYLDTERYLDSVATWSMFAERNPLDRQAPTASLNLIQTLIDGDFPSEIRPRKEEFVARYGIRSQFWTLHDEADRSHYVDTLKTYLTELSRLAHSEAQVAATGVAPAASSDAGPDSQAQKPKAAGKPSPEEAIRLYLQAADWYEQLVATFPSDPGVAENLFLLGEVYTEAGESARAVAAYQRVVREHPDFDKANEAGYAAILGLEMLVADSADLEREEWQRQEIGAQIEFAQVFPGDSRASPVQTDAANSLFALGDYEQAVGLAQEMLDAWPDAAPDLVRTASLIVGHGWFELGGFATAEAAYRRLRAMELPEADRDAVHERLLAAVYKQGEAAEAGGYVDDAINHFLRLKMIDQNAELTIKGHFDAVAIVEDAGRPADAARLLGEFRAQYPDHELTQGIDKRLASLFEVTRDYRQAAREYLSIAQRDPDEAVRRQSLYRAAELDDVRYFSQKVGAVARSG